MGPVKALVGREFYVNINVFPSLCDSIRVIAFGSLSLVLSCGRESAVGNMRTAVSVKADGDLVGCSVKLSVGHFFGVRSTMLKGDNDNGSGAVTRVLRRMCHGRSGRTVKTGAVVFSTGNRCPVTLKTRTRLGSTVRSVFCGPGVYRIGNVCGQFILPCCLVGLSR